MLRRKFMRESLKSALTVTALVLSLGLGSQSVQAEKYPLQQKLQQCEQQFKASRNKSATREQAAKARVTHFKLMLDILEHLNDQNTALVDQGKSLSSEAVTENIRVMGHLLEMLAKEQFEPQAEWSYLY